MTSQEIIDSIRELANKIGDGAVDHSHVGKLNSIMDAVLKTQVPKEVIRMTRLAILSQIEGKPIASAKYLSHKNIEALLTLWGNEGDYKPNTVAIVQIVTLFQNVKLSQFERELALSLGQVEMKFQ